MKIDLSVEDEILDEGSIDFFRDEYGFLSNYSDSIVEYDNVIYPTVEHAYQAAKTFKAKARKAMSKLPDPHDAKMIGNALSIRQDWEDVKLSVMLELLREKFHKDGALAEKLEATGTRELIEGNWWKDTFWGVCNGVGENHLGKLLMEVREENRL